MNGRSWVLLALLFVLLQPCAWAQKAHVGANADSVLEGTVRDARTLAPVSGATVRVRGDRVSGWTVTDEKGTYRITIGSARPLRITVERYGYASLTMDAERLEPAVPLDFVLTPEPVHLAPLTVCSCRIRPLLASLMQPMSDARGASERVMEMSLERDRLAPFAPVVQVVEAASRVRSAGSTEATGGGGIASLGVRGYLTRQGATFVNGAPAVLAEPVSFLVDPFSSTDPSYRLHVWEAGAPARVTGGLEYVAELQQVPRLPDPGLTWRGNLDLVRSSADVAWRARRVEAEASAYTTTPWTSTIVGEGGHRSRMANVATWVVPRAGERLTVSGSVRRESLPSGPGPQASAAILDEEVGSIQWDAETAGGLVEARAGLGGSRTALPSAVSYPGKAPAFSLREARSYLGVDYRRPIGSTVGLDFGADRLGFRWRGSVSAQAATWGFYGEAAYTPDARLGLRVGTRFDGDPGDGHLHPAPRVQLDWRPGHGLEATLGSGVFHQVLLEPSPDGTSGGGRPVLATGAHYRARVTLGLGVLDLSMSTYIKRLTGSGGVPGALGVWGLGFGVDLPHGTEGGLSAAATLERRGEAGSSSWSPLIRLRLDEPIASGTRLRLRIGASRSGGALVFGGTTADSLRVSQGGTLPDLREWSVQADAELSRTIRASPLGHPLRLYAQVLNALHWEYRPLFVESADLRALRVPRVFVIGIGIGSDSRRVSRWGDLAR